MRRPWLLGLLAACAGTEVVDDPTPDSDVVEPVDTLELPATAVRIVLAEDFVQVPAEQDPLRDARPDEVRCLDGAVVAEDGAIEVDTTYCNWAALAAPVQLDLVAGEPLTLAARWFDLAAFEPSRGRIAVLLDDGTVLWDREVEIPSPGQVVEVEVAAPADVRAGDPLHVHVHNHGLNNWAVLGVWAQR